MLPFVLGFLILAPLSVGQETVRRSPLLTAVEATANEDGLVRIVFSLEEPPTKYELVRKTKNEPGFTIFLPGYGNIVPEVVRADDGDVSVKLQTSSEGVWAEISLVNSVFESIQQSRSGLILVLKVQIPEDGYSLANEMDLHLAGSRGLNYRVGPGDLLSISVFGHDDLSNEVRVLANGIANFPLVGSVLVAGKTPSEIAEELNNLLGRDYVVDPQVLVGVSKYQSQPVNVIGEVRNPGKYFLKGPTRVIDILSEAGGLSGNAGHEIIITRRGAGVERSQQIRISIQRLFSAESEEENILLISGDVIHVAPSPVFYIRGEVARPGEYALRLEMTIQKAISIAGGFSQWADEKEVQIMRTSDNKNEKILVNIRKIAKGKSPDVKIQPEDIIVVGRRIL